MKLCRDGFLYAVSIIGKKKYCRYEILVLFMNSARKLEHPNLQLAMNNVEVPRNPISEVSMKGSCNIRNWIPYPYHFKFSELSTC